MSKSQYAPLHALPLMHHLKVIVLTALLILSLLGVIASVTATLLFAPKPELETWMPDGIRCARCGEIESGEFRERVGCRGIEEQGEAVLVKGKVEYGMLEKCWVVDEGVES